MSVKNNEYNWDHDNQFVWFKKPIMDNTEQLMDKMHTPTPWSVSLGRTEGYVMAGRFCIASLGDSAQPRDANAEYIVRCVNSHDALVDALRNLLIAEKIYDDDDPRLIACRDAAIDALKAATE